MIKRLANMVVMKNRVKIQMDDFCKLKNLHKRLTQKFHVKLLQLIPCALLSGPDKGIKYETTHNVE